MKRTRFSEEQIIGVLHEAGGAVSIREVCQTRNYGADVLPLESKVRRARGQRSRRLKGLEDENRRLKKLVAELSLDNAMLKDLVGRKW